MTNAEKRTMISKLYIGQTKKITLKKKTFKSQPREGNKKESWAEF